MTLDRGYLLNKRYRIVEVLGQGGMAAVYRAVDENLGVEVAVKENLFTTEEYARQFRREAVILANLRHPNLPRVTDHFVVEQQGQYLVMDYIEGEDLRQRMDRLGALPDQEVIILGIAICDALEYMHSRKPMVLHRDIKPGNVKITSTGHIYLVDFGLAKVVQGRQATTTGARAMTPGYSPPEQYGTARTDHRTDIYSLGATLYSALTDAIPEDGLARAMDQAVLTPLSKRNPKALRRMTMAIERAMAVRPEDRFQSVEEFKEELLECRSTTRRKSPLDLTVEPPPTFDGEKMKEAGADSKPPQAPEADIELSDFPISSKMGGKANKKNRVRSNTRPLVSPWVFSSFLILMAIVVSASYIMKFPSRESITGLFGLASLPPTAASVTATQNFSVAPTFTQVSVLEPTQAPSVTPSPTIMSTPSSSQTPVPTTTLTPTPALSPTMTGGGTGQIAFVSDRSGVPEIYLINLDGTALSRLTDIPEGACQPAWSPDGARLVFVSPCSRNKETYRSSSLFLINADGSGLSPLIPAVPGGDYDPSWSPDGKKIAFSSLRNNDYPQIYVYNFDDSSITLLATDPPRANANPDWSPDGKQIVYVGHDYQIRVMDADGNNRFLLARNASEYRNVDPIWSPQGVAVVFIQWVTNMTNSWLVAVPYSPEGGVPVIIPGGEAAVDVDFSPDGYWLAISGFPEGNRDIYLMGANGMGKRVLFRDPANEFDPAWKPSATQP
jgi:serine/threonine protein kinase/Tol biopolymer transport system component